jgi:hypothetical protein
MHHLRMKKIRSVSYPRGGAFTALNECTAG